MDVAIATYGLLLAFVFGNSYHFKIRKECIYSVKLTKARIIIPFIFCITAYIGGNQWRSHILVLVVAIFSISGLMGGTLWSLQELLFL